MQRPDYTPQQKASIERHRFTNSLETVRRRLDTVVAGVTRMKGFAAGATVSIEPDRQLRRLSADATRMRHELKWLRMAIIEAKAARRTARKAEEAYRATMPTVKPLCVSAYDAQKARSA